MKTKYTDAKINEVIENFAGSMDQQLPLSDQITNMFADAKSYGWPAKLIAKLGQHIRMIYRIRGRL